MAPPAASSSQRPPPRQSRPSRRFRLATSPAPWALPASSRSTPPAARRFGFEHFKQYDFLRDKEVVLTFDDGPWPENTPAVLHALEDECLKATFFEIGEHATWHPEITKQLVAAGETVGSHTWSHKDLARNPYASDLEQAKQEIEMGVSAVHMAAAAPIAPFFRFPDLQQPPQMLSYLAERNIATFSTDIDSFDFKLRKPELRDQIGDGPARQARQGHHPDARFPAQHRRERCRNCCASSRPAATRSCTWCRAPR